MAHRSADGTLQSVLNVAAFGGAGERVRVIDSDLGRLGSEAIDAQAAFKNPIEPQPE